MDSAVERELGVGELEAVAPGVGDQREVEALVAAHRDRISCRPSALPIPNERQPIETSSAQDREAQRAYLPPGGPDPAGGLSFRWRPAGRLSFGWGPVRSAVR